MLDQIEGFIRFTGARVDQRPRGGYCVNLNRNGRKTIPDLITGSARFLARIKGSAVGKLVPVATR